MRYFFTAALLTLAFTQSKAQSSKDRRDSTVVVIFNENNNAGNHKKSKITGEDNIIKIAPFGFVTGIFPAFFERKINDFFTVQLGAGLTGRNYLRDAISEDNSNLDITYPWGDDPQYSDAVEKVYSYDKRKPGTGYMFSIQPRLYFESEAPEGSFMAVSYDYYHYTSNIPGLSIDGNGNAVYSGPIKNEFENLSDIMVHFGYQTIYDRLTFEYTTGLGIRNVKGSKYAANIDYSTNSINYEGFATYQQTVFNFSVGLKVGYHF